MFYLKILLNILTLFCSCFSLSFEKAYPIVFHIQMDIWISYAAFGISTFEDVIYW